MFGVWLLKIISTLKIRKWICTDCNTKHDRDINADINIKKFALQDQNLIHRSDYGQNLERVFKLNLVL